MRDVEADDNDALERVRFHLDLDVELVSLNPAGVHMRPCSHNHRGPGLQVVAFFEELGCTCKADYYKILKAWSNALCLINGRNNLHRRRGRLNV